MLMSLALSWHGSLGAGLCRQRETRQHTATGQQRLDVELACACVQTKLEKRAIARRALGARCREAQRACVCRDCGLSNHAHSARPRCGN